jgi:hypothetical protein
MAGEVAPGACLLELLHNIVAVRCFATQNFDKGTKALNSSDFLPDRGDSSAIRFIDDEEFRGNVGVDEALSG